MHQPALKELHDLRERARALIRYFAAAASLGVLLIPLAYRGGADSLVLLMGVSLLYLALAGFRLLGGFQADRQMELEHRFLTFAARQGQLLASALGGGGIWRMSGIVQGLLREEQAVITRADRQAHLVRTLTRETRLLLPPAVWLILPAALAAFAGWVYFALTHPSTRGVWLYLVVLPTLGGILALEFRIARLRSQLLTGRDHLLERISDWAEVEWSKWTRKSTGSRRFRHQLLYVDPVMGAVRPRTPRATAPPIDAP